MEFYSTGFENFMDIYEDFSLEDMVLFPSYNDHQCLWIDEEEASSSLQDMSEMSSNDQQHHHHHHHQQQQQQQQVFISNSALENYQELSIFHLLKAYGEAKENKHVDLGDVIEKRLCSKVSPMGTNMERLGHHLLHFDDDHYLREESSKNYGMALRAFYEICPYGRFAHLATNFAILESLPSDIKLIHIIDFDVGEGEQWPALLAALDHRISVKLTVIHCKQVEKTRNNLCSFACSIGLSLQVEEMEMEELLLMFDRVALNENEWFVFNCMVGLPHMGEPKRRRQVLEFTRVAEKVVTSYKGMGMISYGEGFGSRFKPFSDDHLVSSHALFESMEWHFPSHLSLARTTMECLFVGSCVSLLEFVEDFEPFSGDGLRECRVSRERVMEVKEMVMKGRDEPYEIKVDGCYENEMVLQWRGTPMVRVSTWR